MAIRRKFIYFQAESSGNPVLLAGTGAFAFTGDAVIAQVPLLAGTGVFTFTGKNADLTVDIGPGGGGGVNVIDLPAGLQSRGNVVSLIKPI